MDRIKIISRVINFIAVILSLPLLFGLREAAFDYIGGGNYSPEISSSFINLVFAIGLFIASFFPIATFILSFVLEKMKMPFSSLMHIVFGAINLLITLGIIFIALLVFAVARGTY